MTPAVDFRGNVIIGIYPGIYKDKRKNFARNRLKGTKQETQRQTVQAVRVSKVEIPFP